MSRDSAAELARLDRIFGERGCDTAMRQQARRLAAELGVDPPAWAGAVKRSSPTPRPEPGESRAAEWHNRRREDQLRGEWERWRYRRSKLPAAERGRMMELGQRQCRWCEGFFEPSTLRQRYCSDRCRKAAHKRKRKAGT